MKILFLILTISTFSSCSFKNNEALKEVQELKDKVTTLETQFGDIDNDAIKNAKKQYDESLYLIKKYYFKDTIDVQFMNSLDYYKNIKYSSKVINRNRETIGNNFKLVQSQLTILKEDIDNTAIQGEKLKKALLNEKNNVSKLDSAVNLYIKNVETLLSVHDSIAGYVKNKTFSF